MILCSALPLSLDRRDSVVTAFEDWRTGTRIAVFAARDIDSGEIIKPSDVYESRTNDLSFFFSEMTDAW